jgi:hypothetical protein
MKWIKRLITWLAYQQEVNEKDRYYAAHPEEIS